MPIWQLGLPLDFLADSEEPHSSRENGRRELPEVEPGQPDAASVLPDPALAPDPVPPDPVLVPPELGLGPPAHSVSRETETAMETGVAGCQERSAMPRGGQAENRCYTRFTLNAPATIWREKITVAGYLVNISMGGALLRVNPSLPLHESVILSVRDCANPAGLANDLPATVIRSGEGECAVRFDRMLGERGIGDSTNLPLFRYR